MKFRNVEIICQICGEKELAYQKNKRLCSTCTDKQRSIKENARRKKSYELNKLKKNL